MFSCCDSPAETVGVQGSSPHQVFTPRISRHQTLDRETLPGQVFTQNHYTKTCLAKTELNLVVHTEEGFPILQIFIILVHVLWCVMCNCVRCLHPCMVSLCWPRWRGGEWKPKCCHGLYNQHPACSLCWCQQSARYAGDTRRLGGEETAAICAWTHRCQSLIVTSSHQSPATWDMRYHTLGLGLAFLSPPPCVDGYILLSR